MVHSVYTDQERERLQQQKRIIFLTHPQGAMGAQGKMGEEVSTEREGSAEMT